MGKGKMRRLNRYSNEFKITAIKLAGMPGVLIQDVAKILDIHPFMLSRWKKEYREGKSEYRKDDFIGYFVRNAVVVTLADVSKVEEVITQTLQAGVNYIHGIDFQTTELRKYREQARELALKAAKEKADKMATVLGESVGKPIQINELSGGSPWWYWSSWSRWGWGRSQGMSQYNVQADRDGSGEITDSIALGKLTIKANVSVTFELKK